MKGRAFNTVDSLANDLKNAGLGAGDRMLIHSSLQSLGWVCGGAQAVVQALMNVITADGLIVMPAQSTQNTEPSEWRNPPVPQEWWQEIRECMPAYDPRLTPTAHMGAVAECFRNASGVYRSPHPALSFAAWGREAEDLVRSHPLAYPLGVDSPLSVLYRTDARVLMLGTGYDTCTAMHLAEYLTEWPSRRIIKNASAVMTDGKRKWVEYEDYNTDSTDFEQIGLDYLAENGMFIKNRVGAAEAVIIPVKNIVDYTAGWIIKNRK